MKAVQSDLTIDDQKDVGGMRVFNFLPSDYRDEYVSKGFIHVKQGVDPEFLIFAQKFTEEQVAQSASMAEWEFKGKKQQFLFEFPDEGMLEEAKQTVCATTGLRMESFALCERHIKVYDSSAPSNPPPHKDRVASQVTVGLPLVVPDDSLLLLYPDHHLDINPFNSTALYRSSLDDEQLPENLLSDIAPLELDVRPGDVIMFRGSAVYHERLNPANTSLLYLKFNDEFMDPIGEDPQSLREREQTLRLLGNTSDECWPDLKVAISPRLDRVSSHFQLPHWRQVIQVYVWGNKEFTIDHFEFDLLKQVRRGLTVSELLQRMGYSPAQATSDRIDVFRRLARLEAISLMPATDPVNDGQIHGQ